MLKLVIVFVLSFVITQILNSFFLHEKHADLETKKKNVTFKVTAPNGVIGCLSKEKYHEAANFYEKNNVAAVKKMIADEICFFFENGTELEALEGTCDKDADDNDLFPFLPLKFAVLQPFLPCFAVR